MIIQCIKISSTLIFFTKIGKTNTRFDISTKKNTVPFMRTL